MAGFPKRHRSRFLGMLSKQKEEARDRKVKRELSKDFTMKAKRAHPTSLRHHAIASAERLL